MGHVYAATGPQTHRGCTGATYGAVEGEEGLQQLVLGEDRMARHQVDEPAERTSPPLDELAIRDGGQDCGETSAKW